MSSEFYILRALITRAIVRGGLTQPEQKLPERYQEVPEFARDLAARGMACWCLCESSRTTS